MNESALNHSELAHKSEKSGQLCPEWLELIFTKKWFKIFVPQNLGGLGCSLKEALQIEEKLATIDGSLGWTVTLCAGAGWFVGFFEKALAQQIFSDHRVCLAGSGFVGGTANRVGEEFQLNGHWTYASGALHATHFTANCTLLENGVPKVDKNGKPVVKAFILSKAEVEILDGWHFMGMVATGSHAFKTENLRVPGERCFEIEPARAVLPDLIYQYPFLQFAQATLVVNLLGISQHLINLIEKTFWQKHEKRKYEEHQLKYFHQVFQQEVNRLQALKAAFYTVVDHSCLELEKNRKISTKTLKKISQLSHKLTQACREANARLYPFAGLEAANPQSELNRVWRDFYTVSQHALLIFP